MDLVQQEIVDALRAEGYRVQSLTTVGAGCPDILVGAPGNGRHGPRNVLMECKTGNETFTPRQKTWHSLWPSGLAHVVRSVDEALMIVRNV